MKKIICRRIPRRAVAIGVALLALAPVLFCACGAAKVKPATLKPSSEAPGPGVTRLAAGREGFVITEAPQMNDDSRRDFQQAVTLLEDRQYEAAIGLLEKVIERSPRVSAPYIDLAIAYARTEKWDQAETHFKNALSLIPDHPVACNEYGLLLRRNGRFAQARQIYEGAIARYPEYFPLRRNLGILCDLYLNDPAGALQQYQLYSAAVPGDRQVQLWIADLNGRLGK